MGASPVEDEAGGAAGALLESASSFSRRQSLLEPVAAVCDPPTDEYQWDGGAERPPERQ
jgi:hypothetical protein